MIRKLITLVLTIVAIIAFLPLSDFRDAQCLAQSVSTATLGGTNTGPTETLDNSRDSYQPVPQITYNHEPRVVLRVDDPMRSILDDNLTSLLRAGVVLYTMSNPKMLRKLVGILDQPESSTGVADIGYALRLTESGTISDLHVSDWREISFGSWGKFENGAYFEDSMSNSSVRQAIYGGSELSVEVKERLVTSAIQRWIQEANVEDEKSTPGNSWVLTYSTTFDGSNSDRVFVNTFELYKLADISTSADFYMITSKTNTKIKNPTSGDDGEGWQVSYTKLMLGGNEFENSSRSIKLWEYGPTTTVPQQSVSFTIGASISTSAIGESFSYSESWSSPCVTTTDKSDVTKDIAEWRIDFSDPGGFACLKQNCTPAKNTFFTKPSAIFRLTSGTACPTSQIKIGVHPLGNFKNWKNGFLCLTWSWTSLTTHWPSGWIFWGRNLKPFVTSHTPEQSPVTVPVGNFLDFRVSGSDSDGCAISYNWKLDGQTVGSSSAYRYTPQCTDPTTQTIKATVIDPRGGSDNYQWTVFVDKSAGKPGTPIISGPSIVCGDIGAQLSASASNSPDSWNWSSTCGGSFNPPQGNPTTWTPPTGHSGTCQIIMIAANSCGTSTPSSLFLNVERCYSISGQAYYFENGKLSANSGKTVDLYKNGGPYKTDKTDQQGNYSFGSLFRDTYTIKAEGSGDELYVVNPTDFDTAANNLQGYNFNYGADPAGVPTDVEEIDAPGLPVSYVLSQNYPNPFNPETQIEFSLPRRSFVTINVFNIMGARVRTLVSESLPAGHKVVSWNGTDDDGMTVSSGIYLYRIVAGGFIETKKMVLLK